MGKNKENRNGINHGFVLRQCTGCPHTNLNAEQKLVGCADGCRFWVRVNLGYSKCNYKKIIEKNAPKGKI